MDAELDRDEVLGLLDELGGDDDEAALAAARRLTSLVEAAGVGWEALLADWTRPGDDEPEDDEPEDDEPVPEAAPGKTLSDAQAVAMIDRLMARPETSEHLREELMGYKDDIAEGEFEESDRTYLHALNARLSKRR